MSRLDIKNWSKDGSNRRISKSFKGILICSIILCFIIIGFYKAEANTVNPVLSSSVNVRIDYLEELAYVTPGVGNSTKFYFSTDKRSWEIIDHIEKKIDLSALLSSKEVKIYFKGDKDLNILEEKLEAEDNSFKPIYQVIGGEGRIVFNNMTYPIEFRKGINGQWKMTSNMMPTSIYEFKGTTLYFRTMAATNRRAGKIVTVKVPKKPTAPSVKLDGSKFCITGLRSGVTQYRVNDKHVWETFSPADPKVKTMDLTQLFGTGNNNNTPIPAGVIEVRTAATDKKVASAVKVIEVPIQPGVPNTVVLNGRTITINDTDLKNLYEYTRVEQSNVFQINTAKWTTIKTNTPTVVKNASVGDRILVRQKSYFDKDLNMIVLASLYKDFVVTTIID